MATLNENLVSLRKKHQLTQEALSERLGVSAQSISKWENGVSMPDISLLPVIADVLGTSIDSLFGIGKSSADHTDIDSVPEQTHTDILKKACMTFNDIENFEKYKSTLNNNENTCSMVFTPKGAIYADKNLGIAYTQSPDEAIKLLGDNKSRELLSLLSSTDTAAVLAHLVNCKHAVTSASVATKCNITVEQAQKSLTEIAKYDLASHQDINIDGEKISVWKIICSHRLFYLYVIYQMAKKVAQADDNCYYYRGNENWCY
ncbi:MAG: helix-turn-helix transcriptional regulator [Ruminococcaceae bacterium]|nr:helix-turn-helix transcriptional regulator [Oscillospiraceae bacterium]